MISLYKKIKDYEKPQFSMPLSLRYIKECSPLNIDWKSLHIVDLFSIVYSIRIDRIREYFARQKQERYNSKGIESITKATESDFDKL